MTEHLKIGTTWLFLNLGLSRRITLKTNQTQSDGFMAFEKSEGLCKL